MSESFTKGPWTSKRGGKFLDSGGWTADNDKYGSVASVPIKAGRKVVALVVDGANSWDAELTELKGNAALLTAATDLYAALNALNKQLAHDGFQSGTTYGPLCHAAVVALAKARGEG